MIRAALKRSVALIVALAAAGLALAHHDASAHTLGFYPWYYPVGIDDVPVYFDDDFPGGRARDRVADGARQWNDLGRRMFYRVHRTPSINSDADRAPDGAQSHCPTPERDGRRVGMIHWGTVDGQRGGAGAQTGFCWKTGEVGGRHIQSFRLYFDRLENWYAGTGDSRVRNRRTGAIENRVDLWSVATHELGHATGWVGHWNGSASYCSYSSDPSVFRTMCPALAPGTERERTLTGADKHVFRSMYGPR